MDEAKNKIWKKIAVFYALTLAFSGVFNALVLLAGKMDAGNLLYVTGTMWSPALAAFSTKAMFGESIRELPWRWGNSRYAWLGYLIPLAYALPVYLVVWLSGLGAFADLNFIKKTAAQFGWSSFPPKLGARSLHPPDRYSRNGGQDFARAGRRDRLARFSCPGAGQGGWFSRRRTYQRINVGGLPLPGLDLCRL